MKLFRYGGAFLDVIRNFAQEHKLAEKAKPGRGEDEPARDKSDSGRRYMQVSEAYQAGESIADLMERYGVTVGTILDHLTRYQATGKKLRCGEDLLELAPGSPEEQKRTFAAFEKLGTLALRPVFDQLGGRVSYDELKVLRLIFLAQRG